jgi:hypothetical protein
MRTIWVYRMGRVVLKGSEEDMQLTPVASSDFPTPRISRMEPYQSPIDDREITSWRQRDRDMQANDCYDPRDLPEGHEYVKSKGRKKTGPDLSKGKKP